MPNEIGCEKCGNQRAVNRYEFFYGSTFVSSGGRAPFEDTPYPPKSIDRVEGKSAHWICDACIFRKRVRSMVISIGYFIIFFAVMMGIKYYSSPMIALLNKLGSISCCLFVPLFFAIICLLILSWAFLSDCIKDKSEIGSFLAIEAEKALPSIKKRIFDLEKLKKETDTVNAALGINLNPTQSLTFWTPREEKSLKHRK